jgi:hypothetical protein
MADKPTDQPVITEVIPSRAGDVSGIGSLGAPFIYTDWIGSHGHNGAVVNFTLEAVRHMMVGGKTVNDRVVVAHLRMPLHTMMALRNQVELLLQPVPEGPKN